MYDEILLPTNGSPLAEAAIEHAVHVATLEGAVVHAVHVLEAPERADHDVDTESLETAAEIDTRRLLQPITEAAEDAGVEVVESVRRGQTHEQLIEYVVAHDIDLVVMGTHGKSGLSRVLLGSTAEKVVRHSPAPVLTVRGRRE